MSTAYKLLLCLALTPLMGAADPGAGLPPTAICHTEAKPDPTLPAKALLRGYGTGGFAITTTNPEAQAYFDNGMQLAHAFAHGAATAAFKRAEELDPTCAMCVWGEAWSRGPNLNFTIEPADQAELLALTKKAAALAAHNPATKQWMGEQALIAALALRYQDGGGKGPGDYAYARAMDAIATAAPADNELAIMAADGWMIPASHKASRNHLDRAIALLETVLARAPNDTGAIHFYIHATENDGVAAKALPYAMRLQALAPAASHLTHMPSHTYFWVGRYRAAEQANLDAVEIDKANAVRLNTKGGVFGLAYHAHNVMYGEGSALMDGDGAAAMVLAKAQLTQLVDAPANNAFFQWSLGHAYMVFGRYGTDAEVAGLADPGAKQPLLQAMRHYALGEAAARRGDVAEVKAQAAAIQIDPAGMKTFKDGDAATAQALLDVARGVLTGRAAMLQKDWASAEAAYRQAADIQEARLNGFADPPIWWCPVRRSLAAALMADGKPQAAAAEARKAMIHCPYDPVSLRVLADSEMAGGDKAGAARDLAYARSGWVGAAGTTPAALE